MQKHPTRCGHFAVHHFIRQHRAELCSAALLYLPILISDYSSYITLSIEAEILEQRLAFDALVLDMLQELDKTMQALEGRYRPGGPINLDRLGNNVWLRQFQYVVL